MVKRIMVLEDEPMLVELLQDLLTLEGYDVLATRSTDDFMRELRAHPPDAVLIDVNLRDSNGLELLDQIRAQEQNAAMFVVLTSGMDYGRESKQRGADAFLMKPYMPEDLVQLLQNAK